MKTGEIVVPFKPGLRPESAVSPGITARRRETCGMGGVLHGGFALHEREFQTSLDFFDLQSITEGPFETATPRRRVA